MNIFSALLLGLVQGMTEFLPVSSSGHLVLLQSLIKNFHQPGVLFDVTLHAGTLLSVAYYFRKKIFKLKFEYLLLLAVGTIPAVVIGFVFKSFLEGLFTSSKVVGIALILTAFMNYFTDKSKDLGKKLDLRLSFLIGMFQAVAIVPGISRSGSTIFAGTKNGVDGKKAAEFSFLLSVPAVFGANLLEIVSNGGLENFTSAYLIGFIAAFVSGVIAIGLVFKFLGQKKFRYFAYYCFILGALALLV